MFDSILRNKKAGEKLLSVWWFFILVIVGAGISIAVLMYYGAEVDVREVEADILYEKIIDCIVYQGILVEDLFKKDFDVYDVCGLNKGVFNENGFSFRISVMDEQNNKIREDIIGGENVDVACGVQESDVKAEHWAKCVRKKGDVLYYSNNQIEKGVLEVLAASNQIGNGIYT